MKWVVLGNKFSKERYEYLNEYVKKVESGSSVHFVDGNKNDIIQILEQAKLDYSQIRLERPFRETIVDSLETMTSLTRALKTADVFVKSHGQWWPRSTFYEALIRSTAMRLKNIDLTSGVFIVGTGASARAAVAAFIKLGYSKILITDRLTEKGLELVDELKKTFLKVNIEFAPADTLTQLPGDRQILFNTTPYVETNTLLNELYYFNYMRDGGLVIDMALNPVTPPLLEEAHSVGAEGVEGCEIAAWSDVLWAQMCLGLEIEFSEYHQGLRDLLLGLESGDAREESSDKSSESSSEKPPA